MTDVVNMSCSFFVDYLHNLCFVDYQARTMSKKFEMMAVKSLHLNVNYVNVNLTIPRRGKLI